MRALVVLSYDLPNPEAITDVLKAIDPPATPHFAGDARVVPEPDSVDAVIAYLDDDKGRIADRSALIRAAISNAFYSARDAGRTMEHAADDAVRRVLGVLS